MKLPGVTLTDSAMDTSIAREVASRGSPRAQREYVLSLIRLGRVIELVSSGTAAAGMNMVATMLAASAPEHRADKRKPGASRPTQPKAPKATVKISPPERRPAPASAIGEEIEPVSPTAGSTPAIKSNASNREEARGLISGLVRPTTGADS